MANASFPSELVAGGRVSWSSHSTKDGKLQLSLAHVDWQRHMQHMSALEVLEFQGWLVCKQFVVFHPLHTNLLFPWLLLP